MKFNIKLFKRLIRIRNRKHVQMFSNLTKNVPLFEMTSFLKTGHFELITN